MNFYALSTLTDSCFCPDDVAVFANTEKEAISIAENEHGGKWEVSYTVQDIKRCDSFIL